MSYPVDLTGLPVYIKKGFHIENCTLSEEEAVSQGFYKIEANVGNRKIHVPDFSDVLDIPKRNFFELRSLPPLDFTFLFYVPVSESDYDKMKSPAILFAKIGEYYAIYWNQELIVDRSKEKQVNIKDVIIPIPKTLIKIGTNTLCIHIKGDPLSRETGFFFGNPYLFDEFIDLFKQKRIYLQVFFINLSILIGIFYLTIFLKRKEKKKHLYFSLFSIVIAIFFFIRSSLFDELEVISDYNLVFRIRSLTLYLLIPLLVKTYQHSIKKIKSWKKWIFDISFYHGTVFFFFILILPDNTLFDLQLLWLSTIPIIMAVLSISNTISLIEEINQTKKENFLSKLRFSISTESFTHLINVLLLFIPAIFDIILYITKLQRPKYMEIGFTLLMIHSGIRVIFHLLDFNNQLTNLNKKLQAKINKLRKANEIIKLSEKKYKLIFNQTSDILFILDPKGNIIEISDSFEKILKIPKYEFTEKSFFSLIYQDVQRSKVLDLYTERIQNFIENGKTLKIQVPLKSYDDIPFKLFDIVLEKIFRNNKVDEIFARATLVKKDPIFQYLTKEYSSFVFNTDIYLIDNIIAKLTEELSELIDELELSMIRVGLREILINAIEHGNLEITYEDKKKYLEKGNYHEYLRNKLRDPHYQNKKVIVEYRFTPKEVAYKITDEGNGFDVKKYLEKKNIHLDSLHGRGIFIAKNAFDRIVYNSKGNSVTLIKKISKTI
ncbi:MAG: ATP-binding protein [Leptospiraceae bacterium]|nr:ATP-binding protein [Leptospiraceae bacterium]